MFSCLLNRRAQGMIVSILAIMLIIAVLIINVLVRKITKETDKEAGKNISTATEQKTVVPEKEENPRRAVSSQALPPESKPLKKAEPADKKIIYEPSIKDTILLE